MDREALLNLPPPRPIVDVVTSVKKMLASGEAVSGTEVKVTNTLSLSVSHFSLLKYKRHLAVFSTPSSSSTVSN